MSTWIPIGIFLGFWVIVIIQMKSGWQKGFKKRAEFPPQVKTHWLEVPLKIKHDPILIFLLSNAPQEFYSSGKHNPTHPATWGAVGIVDQTLVFEGNTGDDQWINLATIRWVGVKTLSLQEGKYAFKKEALVVHAEQDGEWRVLTFLSTSDNPWANIPSKLDYATYEFGKQLAELCKLEFEVCTGRSEDFGPTDAQQMNQDVYGQWHPADDSRLEKKLYLAPDRLIYGWKDTIHLAQIRKLEVYAEGTRRSINPFAQDLLRIEYEADGNHVVTGFLLRHADEWGTELAKRTGVPFDWQEGRKKKSE
ncbi:MAG TPA: hypothetical protein VHP83_10955 [Aggregatilineaceae bacterium]|nr:hypothetical protein [Aggregatilineaceae bacterium]